MHLITAPSKPLLLLACALGLQAAAAADDDALRRCRALGEAAARLACYDALPLAALPAAIAAIGAPPAVAALGQRAAPPAAPATAAKSGEESFGFEGRSATQEVSSSIPGIFEGWDRRTRFRLANGQVWQVIDDSSAAYYLRDPKVVVRRAALGSFMMEIEGARQAPRVRRVE